MKNSISLFLLASMLMATQCGEDDDYKIFRDKYRVRITDESTYNINDTIWIEGRVSAREYNSEISDSTLTITPEGFQIAIYRFTQAPTYNAKDAIDRFDISDPDHVVTFLEACPNGTILIHPIVDPTGNLYRFKVGLIPKSAGDFIFNFPYRQQIEDLNSDLSLITNYPSPGNNYLIGFNSCGNLTQTSQTDIGDFCFTVN